jgi:phage terminase large subunit-like protein
MPSAGDVPVVDDPVTAYAHAVVDGTILAGRLVRLACARHLRDLTTLVQCGYRFSLAHALHAIEFFPKYLRLYDAGEHTGEPFVLGAAWQFIVGSLYGWLAPDGYRRFAHAYVEMGKGNVKSMTLAGLELYSATCDGEPGAQVFTAAVTREQAHVIHDDAVAMAVASPEMRARLKIGLHNIYDPASRSYIRPISSEGRSLDGKRVHFAGIDELHEHPTPVVATKMAAGLKGRRQGLVAEITNSGADRTSVCWEHRERSRRILEQLEANEQWFAYVCQLDVCDGCRARGYEMPQEGCRTCDDWRDERVWIKTNPELDRAVPRAYLRKQRQDALEMPSTQSWAKRVNWCIWTENLTRWLTAEAWAICGRTPVDAEALKGRPCIAGLDFSRTDDLTALVLLFPDDDFFAAPEPLTTGESVDAEPPAAVTVHGGVRLLAYFWCPEEGIVARSRKDRVPYELWRDQGLLEPTPGGSIDYRRIRRRILALRETGYDLREIAYDPAFATQLAIQLHDEDGFPVVPIAQTFASLTEPIMLVEALVQRGALAHGGNALLAWNVANAVVDTDPGGRRILSKGKSTERIDGAAALVTGMKRLFVVRQATSIYDTRGVVVV